MSKTYTVVDGDTMEKIAADNGFADWHTIWNDPGNAALRAKRPDPHWIFPGDQVFIPDNPSAPLTVTFRVVDADGGAALAGATVEVTGILRERTDASGNLTTTLLKTGVANDLKVSLDGFRCTYGETGIFWYTDWSALPTSGEASLRQPINDGAGNPTGVFGIVFSPSRTSYEVKLRRDWRIIPVAGAPGATVTVDASTIESEVVLVAGADQHERSYGNGMRFPAQAVRELRVNFASEKHVAILLFNVGYTDEMVKAIRGSATKLNSGATVVTVASTDELMNYINCGTTTAGAPTRHQAEHGRPIKALMFFSHGRSSNFLFDMDGPSDAACALGLDRVASFNPTSFLPNATVIADSCRIGNSSTAELIDDMSKWRDEAKPENSLAQRLAEQLNLDVHAYLLRTEYSATWDQQNDASVIAGNRDIADTFAHNKDGFFADSSHKTHVLWNDEGAHQGITAGSTPVWLNQADTKRRFVFKKGVTPAADGAP